MNQSKPSVSNQQVFSPLLSLINNIMPVFKYVKYELTSNSLQWVERAVPLNLVCGVGTDLPGTLWNLPAGRPSQPALTLWCVFRRGRCCAALMLLPDPSTNATNISATNRLFYAHCTRTRMNVYSAASESSLLLSFVTESVTCKVQYSVLYILSSRYIGIVLSEERAATLE